MKGCHCHECVSKLVPMRGNGMVQWSAQKLATPRVEGSNPGLSLSVIPFQPERRGLFLQEEGRSMKVSQKEEMQ